MDSRLRNAQRTYQEEPERWLREASRSGLIPHIQIEEPVTYFDALFRAGLLGPRNGMVFGMLGCRPAIKALGGDITVGEEFTYWHRQPWRRMRYGQEQKPRGPWFTEEQVLAPSETWGSGGWWRGNDHHDYRKLLNRLSHAIRTIPWMKRIAIDKLKKDNTRSLDVWLVEREHRTILLAELIGASWTAG